MVLSDHFRIVKNGPVVDPIYQMTYPEDDSYCRDSPVKIISMSFLK